MSTIGFNRYKHMYILTEGRNFKTLLNKNYAVALDSLYLQQI